MPSFKISLSTLLIIPLVLADPSGGLLATLISALLHELGHLSTTALLGIGVQGICVTPYGLEITAKRRYGSFFEEITVISSGCFINLITFISLSRLGGRFSDIAYSSLVLGILNALPIIGLDGGEAMRSALSRILSYRTAEKLSLIISFITLLFTWSLSAYIFMFSGYNYSLFIMCIWLFLRTFCPK